MPEYSILPGYFTVRPDQQTGVVDFSRPEGRLSNDPDPPQQPDPPRVTTPLPDLTAREDEPFTYDASQHFSSDDTLMYSSSQLPAVGLDINGDGLIAGTPTGGTVIDPFVVTAKDSFDQTASSAATLSVSPAPVDPPPIEGRYRGGANARSCMNSSSLREVIFYDPEDPDNESHATGTQKAFQIMSVGGVHQGLFFFTPGDRRLLRRMTLWLPELALQKQVWVPHCDITVVPVERPGSNNFERATFDWVWANQANKEKGMPRSNSDEAMAYHGAPSIPHRQMWSSCHSDMCDMWVNQRVANLYRPGDENLEHLWPAIFSDAMRIVHRRGGPPQFIGTVSGTGPGNIITASTWAGIPAGNPDPNNPGFTYPKNGYFAQISPTNWSFSRVGKTLRSYKDNGDGTMDYLFKEKVPSGIGGHMFRLYRADGITTSMKWPDANTDGTTFIPNAVSQQLRNPGHISDNNEIKHRIGGWLRFFRRQDDYTFQMRGKRYGPCLNSIGGTYLTKWNSGITEVHALHDKCSQVHSEHTQISLSDSSGFNYLKNNNYVIGYNMRDADIDYYVRKFPFGASYLARRGQYPDFGKPYVMGSYNLGRNAGLTELNNVAPLMVAYGSWWETFIIMAGGGAWLPNGAYRTSARQQFHTGLFNISLGDFPITPETAFNSVPEPDVTDDYRNNPSWAYTLQWGLHKSYDPSARDDRGDGVIRPSDWGNGDKYQWEMWWKDPAGRIIVTVLNARTVRNPVIGWDPETMETDDGDLYTLHDIAPGWEARHINLRTDRNVEDGMLIGEGLFAAIHGDPVNIQFDEDFYGTDDLIGGTGQNGAQIRVKRGRALWYVIDRVKT